MVVTITDIKKFALEVSSSARKSMFKKKAFSLAIIYPKKFYNYIEL